MIVTRPRWTEWGNLAVVRDPDGRSVELYQVKGELIDQTTDLARAHLRVARPTDDLDAVVRFYRDGLGFTVLAEFRDHDGFDGVMLGQPGAAYHLEFTRKRGHEAGKAPTQDNPSSRTPPGRGEDGPS